MGNISEIKEIAKILNLSNLAKGKIDLNADYKNKLDYLEYVLREELSYRKKTRIKNNKEISSLPNIKFNKSYLVDGVKWQIKEIEKLKFIEEDRNIIITGNCGTGKTALATEIGNVALEKGYKVVYRRFDDYLFIVNQKLKDNKQNTEYNKLKNADVIIIDDFLYLNIKDSDLEMIYKSLIFFNESRSLILISNRKPDEFIEAANDKHIINTLIERLKGNSHIITL